MLARLHLLLAFRFCAYDKENGVRERAVRQTLSALKAYCIKYPGELLKLAIIAWEKALQTVAAAREK